MDCGNLHSLKEAAWAAVTAIFLKTHIFRVPIVCPCLCLSFETLALYWLHKGTLNTVSVWWL